MFDILDTSNASTHIYLNTPLLHIGSFCTDVCSLYLSIEHVDVLPFKDLMNFLGTLKEGSVELPEEKGVLEWFKSMDGDKVSTVLSPAFLRVSTRVCS